MKGAAVQSRTYRFATFELDSRSGELLKEGRKLRLQEQPFQVLRLLLENPGEVVTREELRQKLWPEDTFVDFDHGLNNAVNRLRELLSDSAEKPRYIETLPRRGYRFIAPVEPAKDAEVIPGPPKIPQPPPPKTTPRPGRWILWVALSCAAVLGIGGFGWYARHRPARLTAVQSIVVLPLENLSGDPSQEYFADGLTDAVTTELARIHSLRVVSRNSAMQYKGHHAPVSQIARELNVDAVLEGSVTRSGDRVRVTAQLIHATRDQHLWADSYDRDVRDILGLQSEIARTVAERVRAELSTAERARLTHVQNVDPEAYDLYQRGRFYAFSKNEQDLAAAIDLLGQAIARDPNFAAAHAILSRAYMKEQFMIRPHDTNLELKAIAEVNQALKLDPDLADAYLARGAIFWTHRNGFPHERAIVELKRSIELDANLAEAHHQLGSIYMHVGLFDKADHELQTALDLDPTNIGVRYRIAINRLDQNKLDEAITGLQGTQRFSPDLWAYQMALALFKLGRKQEASALIRDYLRDHPEDPGGVGNGMQALLYADAGQVTRAQKSIEAAIQKGKDFGHFHHTAYTIGSAYAVMNRPKEAVRWLRAAAEDGFPCYPLYEQDPALQNIREDPGFLELMAAMGSDWERRRATL
jgi:TolB-like protein/DNA-binding winged helix-turn-helix (wHTH) protein/Tfp pilus assembly protein PilF